MSDTTTNGKHSFFQSITSVLPTHHRHNRAEDDIIRTSGTPASTLPTLLDNEPPSEKTRKKAEQLSAADQLTLFRSLVGIDNPPGLHSSTFFSSGKRPADNIGIYARVVKKEEQAGRSYKYFSAFISFCISAQVLVAACLTALGAGNASHRAVTAFGALNTVLAGFMAYFKGSGLPNRLKYYKNEWTKLREYIEQRERDFCRQDHGLDLEAEVLTIERMYEEVKGDVEANTPDSFVSIRDISKRGGAIRPGPPIAGGAVGNVVDGMAEKVQDRADRSVAGLKRNLSYQSSQFGAKAGAYGDQMQAYGDEKFTGAVRYGDEKITGYGQQAARYGDEKMAAVSTYGNERLTAAGNYGNERLAAAGNYGNEKVQDYGDRIRSWGSDAVRPYQERAASYQDQVRGYQDQARGLQDQARGYQEQARGIQEEARETGDKFQEMGKKAFEFAGKVSSFLERPHSVGVTVDAPKPATPTATTQEASKELPKEKKPEDMV